MQKQNHTEASKTLDNICLQCAS